MRTGQTLEAGFSTIAYSWRSSLVKTPAGQGNSLLEQRLAPEGLSNIDVYEDFNDRISTNSPTQAMKGRQMDDASRSNYSRITRGPSGSQLGKPPTQFSRNLQKMKEDYHTKIAALTQKVEEEKERQRRRSNQHKATAAAEMRPDPSKRSRSRSQNKIELEKYANEF